MQDFRDEGFILEDDLSFRSLRPDELAIEGRIRCQNGLFIDVKKFLEGREYRGRIQFWTVDYRYHAGVEGSADRGIFRYDNAHAYGKEGHPDAHHKHRFDHTTWREITPPEWIGEERWPHLSDVIEELRQWWETTGQLLDLAQPEDDATTSVGGP